MLPSSSCSAASSCTGRITRPQPTGTADAIGRHSPGELSYLCLCTLSNTSCLVLCLSRMCIRHFQGLCTHNNTHMIAQSLSGQQQCKTQCLCDSCEISLSTTPRHTLCPLRLSFAHQSCTHYFGKNNTAKVSQYVSVSRAEHDTGSGGNPQYCAGGGSASL